MDLCLKSTASSAEIVASRLEDDIETLKLKPGTRLQPLRELAVKYNTSYLTIRKATNSLCQKGILSSRRGSGVYIASNPKNNDTGKREVKNKTISLVFCGMEEHITTRQLYNRLLYGVEKQAREQGYNVVISLLKDIESFRKSDVFDNSAGFLMLGDDRMKGIKDLFKNKSAVWVMGGKKAWGDHISYDNREIGVLAAEQLVAKGHKNLACINVDPIVGRERCSYFNSHAESLGANVVYYNDPDALITNRFEQHVDHEVIDGWVRQMKQMPEIPTGFFVVDMAAFTLYNSLIEHEIKPGTDVEIATCNWNDVSVASVNYQPLNIYIYPEEIGKLAVKHLEWKLDNPKAKRIVMSITPEIDQND